MYVCGCALLIPTAIAANSTYTNPIFPGFFPDPSCIFVPERDDTFFCASSSFEAFPGIPIHASKDLVNWKLISNVLNRPDQLPDLAITNKSTSGIWASTIRYHQGTFFIMTTLVFDDADQFNSSRWDNMVFQSKDPFKSSSWSDPVHFDFVGYDTSPYWGDNGTVYVTGSHPWHVAPGITMTTIDLTSGEVGSGLRFIWNGTGGLAPEGPHIYSKDGWYYLMIAEGGTGLTHMETIARSKTIDGPYTPNSANPIVTNANTSQYFQTVGHADLFQDPAGSWWGVSLATRSGPNFTTYPMGRETVMFPVTWKTGDWPILQLVRGQMSGWQMPPPNITIAGEGYVSSGRANVTILTVQTFHGYCRPPHLPPKVELTHTPCPLAHSYQWQLHCLAFRPSEYSSSEPVKAESDRLRWQLCWFARPNFCWPPSNRFLVHLRRQHGVLAPGTR